VFSVCDVQEERAPLLPIINTSFPMLLSLMQQLVANNNPTPQVGSTAAAAPPATAAKQKMKKKHSQPRGWCSRQGQKSPQVDVSPSSATMDGMQMIY